MFVFNDHTVVKTLASQLVHLAIAEHSRTISYNSLETRVVQAQSVVV